MPQVGKTDKIITQFEREGRRNDQLYYLSGNFSIGYLTCGKIRGYGGSDRMIAGTGGASCGVDYEVMPQWKLFLVQLLCSGLGRYFSAMQGACGDLQYFSGSLSIAIFAGGVDYFQV